MDDRPPKARNSSEQKTIFDIVGELDDAAVAELLDSFCAALADTTSPEFVASVRTVPLREIRAWLTGLARELDRGGR